MTSSEVKNTQRKIHYILSTNRIHDAIPLISKLVNDTIAWQLHDSFNQFKTEYKYLLNYFIEGINDPEREKIYNNFIARLHSITDQAVSEILTREDYGLYYATKRTYKKTQKNLLHLLESYKNSLSQYTLYREIPNNNKDVSIERKMLSEKENIEIEIFKYIWTSYPQSTLDIEQISSIFEEDSYPLYFKSFIISSIMLSLLEYYNETLFVNLLKLYDSTNNEISVKSLCATIIVMYNHNFSIINTKKVKDIIGSFTDKPQFINDVKNILFTLTKSRNTEKISRKVNDELIPNLMKIYPKVFSKIKDDKNTLDISDLDENPEWKDIIENENITKKIEELNKLQLDGGDVFIGTFSHLKSFPFFNEISNWFIPFHKDHSMILNSLSPSESKQLETILDSKFFCDSDKYSFVASLASVPQSQRSLMFTQLNEHNDAINEFKKNDLKIDTPQLREHIINNYIQNIYRFYNIFNRKIDFYNPLNNCYNILIIKKHFENVDFNDIITIVAEFYLKNEYYNDATQYYHILINDTNNFKPIILQKIGFCYQNLEKYENAIEFYHKFELYSENDLWNLKHLAACYRALKQPQKALEYYLAATNLSPDNIPLNLNIGHCYIETNNYEEALKHYFKIYYLEPNNQRVLRPLAWSLFVQKYFEQSRVFYNKILQYNPTSTDYLNVGHLEFICGNIKKAIFYYKESILTDDNNLEQFIHNFKNDEEILLNMGIKGNDISILLDSLSQDFDNQ